jgi:hypothetical protein
MKIELERQDCGYFVRVGDAFDHHLGRDEALGAVAAVLFGLQPPYLKTYEGHIRWGLQYCGWERGPFLALPAAVVPMPVSEFVIFRRELIADARGV